MAKSGRHHQFPWRSNPGESHWLGEGVNGQESLLFDLDPHLVVVDHALCRAASQFAHRYQGENSLPIAVIDSPDDFLPWQAAFLRQQFEVFVLSGGVDPILEELCHAFDLSHSVGELPARIVTSVDFAINLHLNWTLERFGDSIRHLHDILSGNGVGIFTLPVELRPSGAYIEWIDGATLALSALEEMVQGKMFQTGFSEISSFEILFNSPDRGAGEFYRRHKEFFGRNFKDAIVARFFEADFTGAKESRRGVSLFVIEGVIDL